jgi:hypothetical protein
MRLEQKCIAVSSCLLERTIFDSDVERRDETPAFLGEQKYDLAGAW